MMLQETLLHEMILAFMCLCILKHYNVIDELMKWNDKMKRVDFVSNNHNGKCKVAFWNCKNEMHFLNSISYLLMFFLHRWVVIVAWIWLSLKVKSVYLQYLS